MKVAALYDIHGNLPALEAVLAEVEREGADAIVFGGDVDGGPFPSETLDLLRSRPNTRFVMGNADRFVVEDVIDPTLPEPVREGLSWSHDRLSAEHRAFLASFEKAVTLEIDRLGPVFFCHGSPRSDEELVTEVTPDDVVEEMVGDVVPELVVLGHTHMQFDRAVGRHRIVNAGSVGMPYADRPGAYWALLGGRDVELRRTDYDLEAAAARIRATGWPGAEEFAAENVLTIPTAEEATAVFERQAGR